MEGPVEVIGGDLSRLTCYVRDSQGIVEVDCDYAKAHPQWYARIGTTEYGDELATFYILLADPPVED